MLRRAGRNPTSHVLARGQSPGSLWRMEQLGQVPCLFANCLDSTNGHQKKLRQRQEIVGVNSARWQIAQPKHPAVG
jgi:hypothetical protein